MVSRLPSNTNAAGAILLSRAATKGAAACWTFGGVCFPRIGGLAFGAPGIPCMLCKHVRCRHGSVHAEMLAAAIRTSLYLPLLGPERSCHPPNLFGFVGRYRQCHLSSAFHKCITSTVACRLHSEHGFPIASHAVVHSFCIFQSNSLGLSVLSVV